MKTKLLISLIPLILILFLFVSIGIIIINENTDTSKTEIILRNDLPLNDFYYINYASGPSESRNEDVLNVGCLSWKYERSMMQFNISDRPINYSSCVIQFYIFNVVKQSITPIYTFSIFLNYGSWNENMSYTEFINTWGDWDKSISLDNESFDDKIGFVKINITNYIESYDIFSIRLDVGFPGVFDYNDYNYYQSYTKESIISMRYKPQLIWSRY